MFCGDKKKTWGMSGTTTAGRRKCRGGVGKRGLIIGCRSSPLLFSHKNRFRFEKDGYRKAGKKLGRRTGFGRMSWWKVGRRKRMLIDRPRNSGRLNSAHQKVSQAVLGTAGGFCDMKLNMYKIDWMVLSNIPFLYFLVTSMNLAHRKLRIKLFFRFGWHKLCVCSG